MKRTFFVVLVLMLCYGLISLLVGMATGDMTVINWMSEHKLLLAIIGCWSLMKFVIPI